MSTNPPNPHREPAPAGSAGHELRSDADFEITRIWVPKARMPEPGTAPGWQKPVETVPPDPTFAKESRPASEERTPAKVPASQSQVTQPLDVTCIDYSHEQITVEKVNDLGGFLSHHRPEWSRVRWINVVGLSNTDFLAALAEKYQLHPLAVEDVLLRMQRPKVEDYPGEHGMPGRMFVVARLIEFHDGLLHTHQVNFFLGRNTLITIQDEPAEVFKPVLSRLQKDTSRLRNHGPDFLLYALLDAIVDNVFPILEKYSTRIEDLEEEMLSRSHVKTLNRIHAIKRELLLVRRVSWPMRDLIAALQRETHEGLSQDTQTFFRDVYDHCIQAIDLIETYREITSALTETYLSTMSNKTNDVMKVLTVIGTIFLPLTFLAGVYGMNMPIPEIHWKWLYGLFWLICIVSSSTMIAYFRHKGWL